MGEKDVRTQATAPAAPVVTKILEQGPEYEESVAIDQSLAGKYRVLHGNLALGHTPNGPSTRAHRGAIVQLSAEDAHHMLAVGTVERVNERAA